jgi:hypothetical protein
MVEIGMVTTKRNEGALMLDEFNLEIKLSTSCRQIFRIALEGT